MKGNFLKHLLLALLLPIFIILGACAKPEATTPPPTPPETPEPAEFAVTELIISPDIAMPSDNITVTATIYNIGGTEGNYTAVLTLDSQEVERKDVQISPGAAKTATFELTSPETSGAYTLSVGGVSTSLQVSPWVAHTIKYDNERVSKYWTNYGEGGWLSYFEIPSNTFRIKGINMYGFIKGLDVRGLEERSFTLRIWDNKLSQELFSQSYPYGLFPIASHTVNWVEVEIPDLRVDNDFYVEVVTSAEHAPDKDQIECGLYIGLDLSATEGNADLILNGVVQPWDTQLGAKETAAWMVRVEGEREPKLERYTLSYDDGTPTASYYSGNNSHLIHFSPPSEQFIITQVLIYGWIEADSPTDYQDREFSVKAYSKAGEELWNQDFTWWLFDKDSAKWVEIDVPDISVSDDFYVEVTTHSNLLTRLYISFDSSTPNEHSDMSRNGIIISWQPWTWEGVEYTREKVNWMIRVKGTASVD